MWVTVPVYEPVVHETVVVHHGEPDYEPEPAAVVRKPRTPRHRTFGMILRLGGFAFAPEDRQFDGEDLSLGSIGAALRINLDPHWAIELSAETAEGSDSAAGIRRSTTPLQASLVLNLLPRSSLNLYGLLGTGVYFTDVRDSHCGCRDDYHRFGVHIGGGVELKLSQAFRLFADLRFIGLGDPQEQSVDAAAMLQPMEEGNSATQFTAGLGVFF